MKREEYYNFLDRYNVQILGYIKNIVKEGTKIYQNRFIYSEKITSYIELKIIDKRFYSKIDINRCEKEILKYIYNGINYQFLNAIKIKNIKMELKWMYLDLDRM